MSIRLMTVAIRQEQDVVTARQRARQIAALLGFESQDQARIATAVSEIARNAFRYAAGGEVEFSVEGERAPQLLAIEVRDKGRGIAELESILAGRYRSETGMGLGITGARRLMDRCLIRSTSRGTSVLMQKVLPDGVPLVQAGTVARLTKELVSATPSTPLDEVLQQNRELIRTMDELRERQDEVLRINRELEDTNRGVVALYAELEERADFLRRADEMKSRFLSNMSHEFRTPLNSIRALTRLLLERSDGPLTGEQEVQLQFVAKATEQLSELVEDLLDLAKIEAGKLEVHPAEFSVPDLFSALRGMLRPLLVSDKVALRFDVDEDLPALYTDENKISQILRNFISNAIKFTERGEIRTAVDLEPGGEHVVFSVADTGIGIPEEEHERIFEEFTQVRNPLQTRVRGTGLGLPLCRRLATLLGGTIWLKSRLGEGSTFFLRLPLQYVKPPEHVPARRVESEQVRIPVLVVEDRPEGQLVYEKFLRGTAYVPIQARTLRQAKDAFARDKPAAVVLDIMLGNESSWRWLGDLKGAPESSGVPVIVASDVDDPAKGYALGADLYLPKPVERGTLLDALDRLTRARILIIDDDPAARYAIRKLCDPGPYHVVEAADAREGLKAASTTRPELIVLDLNLPDLRGEEVLRRLHDDAGTQSIPVIVATSEDITDEKRERLGAGGAAAVFAKKDLDRDAFTRVLASVLPNPSPATPS
jgi:signal transduction histidine kinase/DNA-binding response OmpR family regulator